MSAGKLREKISIFLDTVKQMFNILYSIARGLLNAATVLQIPYKKIERELLFILWAG
jgi:hypothetical protein